MLLMEIEIDTRDGDEVIGRKDAVIHTLEALGGVKVRQCRILIDPILEPNVKQTDFLGR